MESLRATITRGRPLKSQKQFVVLNKFYAINLIVVMPYLCFYTVHAPHTCCMCVHAPHTCCMMRMMTSMVPQALWMNGPR